MSLAMLKKLVPPPPHPFEVGTLAQWRKMEAKLGKRLPRDYRDFVFTYGSGLFAGFYIICNPFAKSQYTCLPSRVEMVCKHNRESRISIPERYPFPYHPEPGGLIPWGYDENGNDYFWLPEGPPTKWTVVQDENRGSGIRRQPYSLTGFLAAVLTRKVRALASGYPRKGCFRFDPWDPAQ